MNNKQIRLSKLNRVERPFLKQLEGLGWRTIEGDKYDPEVSLRESFREVFIENELRKSTKNINPWIEGGQR